MSELLYDKERRIATQVRSVAAAMGRQPVVEACDSILAFIDKHSPRLDGDQEDQ